MKIEVNQILALSKDQETLLDMHSFLNKLNVFISQYYQIGRLIGSKEPIRPIIDNTSKIVTALKDLEKTRIHLSDFNSFKQQILKTLDQIQHQYPDQARTGNYEFAVQTIHSILNVMEMRSRERLKAPDQWVRMDIQYLKNEFSHIFSAVEQYSNGLFRLVDNIASQEDQDYLIRPDIHNHGGDWIFMPAVFQDVMRDLILNARKYTLPGGEIIAGRLVKVKHSPLLSRIMESVFVKKIWARWYSLVTGGKMGWIAEQCGKDSALQKCMPLRSSLVVCGLNRRRAVASKSP
jgi:signal transduction histidine kinase